jgi:hypothetical protein
MKKQILLLMLFYVISINSNSQNYPSIFGKDSTQWNYQSEGVDYTYTEIFKAKGDTVINSIHYFKLYNYYDLNKINSLLGFIREDTLNGNVWFLIKDSIQEHVLINFSLNVGDNINYYFTNNPHKSYSVVSKIDSITHIDNGLWGFDFVEGVGLFQNFYSYDMEFYSELICMYKDGIQIYQNPISHGECFVNGGIFINKILQDFYSIKRNAKDIVISTTNNKKYPIGNIKIFSITGKLLFESKTDLNMYSIPIPLLEKGVNIFLINNQYYQKVLVQ